MQYELTHTAYAVMLHAHAEHEKKNAHKQIRREQSPLMSTKLFYFFYIFFLQVGCDPALSHYTSVAKAVVVKL